MADLDDLNYKSITEMTNDEAIELMRQIRLRRRTPPKKTARKKPARKKAAPKVNANQALEILKTPPYTEEENHRDRELFIKKLRITDDELDYYLHLPRKKHEEYDTNDWLYNILSILNSTYISIRGKRLIQ